MHGGPPSEDIIEHERTGLLVPAGGCHRSRESIKTIDRRSRLTRGTGVIRPDLSVATTAKPAAMPSITDMGKFSQRGAERECPRGKRDFRLQQVQSNPEFPPYRRGRAQQWPPWSF